MKKLTTWLVVASCFSPLVMAEELKIKPGLWRYDNAFSVTMNIGGQEMTSPVNQSVDERCVTPEDAVLRTEDISDETCQASNIKATNVSMSFDLVCSNNGLPMTGSMSFELSPDKDKGTGKVSMSGSMPGQGEMNASGEIKATRIGAC